MDSEKERQTLKSKREREDDDREGESVFFSSNNSSIRDKCMWN